MLVIDAGTPNVKEELILIHVLMRMSGTLSHRRTKEVKHCRAMSDNRPRHL